MQISSTHRPFGAAAVFVAIAMTGACSLGIGGETNNKEANQADSASGPGADSATGSGAGAGGSTPIAEDPASDLPTVRGYRPGEIPPIPLFVIPDLSMLNESLAGFAIDTKRKIGSYEGLQVTAAKCDGEGRVISNGGGTVVVGDGAATFRDPTTTIENDGKGAGRYSDPTTTVVVNGDGSGRYSDPTTTVLVNGDGSGRFSDPTVTVQIDGKGAGRYSDPTTTIVINGDGSGRFSDPTVTIVNNGDGSGRYSDPTLTIKNDGKGTALVNGDPVRAEPLAPVPDAGKFPSMGTLQPVKSCGVTITLSDGVLFDFGKADIRPEAGKVLGSVAQALTDLEAPKALIGGHTDSIGTDSFNLDLSERRAAAVASALRSQGVRATIQSTGYGETKPVAPNEADGKDNPAGRALNRRVEIFVPTF